MKSYNNLSRKSLLAISFVLCYSYAICQVTEGWHKAGSHPNDYEMKIVADVKHNGNGSVMVSALKEDIDGFGTYMQTFKADNYLGERLQLTGWIKTEDVSSAQMWMRLDGIESMTGFDNMASRSIKGTNDWQEYSIVLDIPKETILIAFGAFVHGSGTAWVDDYSFEVVGADVSTTNMLFGEPPEKTEKQKSQYQKHLKTNYPDYPHNLECDERQIDILDMREK